MTVYLHLLYAGRGDSMIVENRAADGSGAYYMLDGGPLNREHGGGHNAPYYRYLTSYAKRVNDSLSNKSRNFIAPDAIIISHPHDDHFGGLMQMLSDYLPDNWVDPASPGPAKLVFNGPLLLPLTGSEQFKILDSFLVRQKHFGTSDGAGVLPGFALGGPARIRTYSRARRPPLGRVWSPDDSPDNIESILMWERSSGMIFTGDSVGWKIAPFLVANKVPADNKPKFKLFKVPHHGSLRNSQRYGYRASINDTARADYALSLLLRFQNNPDACRANLVFRCFPDAFVLQDERKLRIAAKIAYDYVDGLRTATPGGVLSDVSGRLDQADAAFKTGATTWQPSVGAVDTTAIWEKVSELIHAAFSTREQLGLRPARGRARGRDASPGRDRSPSPRRQAVREERTKVVPDPWVEALVKKQNLANYYERLICLKQLCGFFSGFETNAFAISADKHYSHPSAETIAAIARVAEQESRRTVIVVTDGRSVDLSALEWLAPNWKSFTNIRYFKTSARATLNPGALNPAAWNPGAIDVSGTTGDLVGATDLMTVHQTLSQNVHTLPDEGRGFIRYQLKTGDGKYLSIDNNEVPVLTATPTSCSIEEWWQTDRLSFRDSKVTDNSSTKSCFCSIRVKQNQGKVMYITRSGDRFVSTDGSVVTDPDDPKAAVFTLEKAPVTLRVVLPMSSRAGLGASTPAAGSTFRQFCADAGIMALPVALSTVIVAMLGPEATAQLDQELTLQIDRLVLTWSVNADNSTVTYQKDPSPLTVTAAILVLDVPPNAVVTAAGEALTLAGATMTVSWDANLTVVLDLRTTQGLDVTQTETVASARHSIGVVDYLTMKNVTNPAAMSPGKALAVMLGSEMRVEQLLLGLPPFLIAANLPNWAIGSESSVEIETNPGGGLDVPHASLKLLPVPSAKLSFDIDGLSIALSAIAVDVFDARLFSEDVVVTAKATIGGVTLDAWLSLVDTEAGLALTMSQSATLADLVALLPGRPDLSRLGVPMTNGGLISSFVPQSLGVSLVQATPGSSSYRIDSVFFSISFNSWTSLLPSSMAAPTASSIFVQVYNPLAPQGESRVGVEVNFTFAVGSMGKSLSAQLSAWPLAGPTDYAYTVALDSDPTQPCTFAETLGSLLLTKEQAAAASALPVLGSVLNDLNLVSAWLSLEADGSTPPTFSEFGLNLSTAGVLSLIDGVLELDCPSFALEYANGEWAGSAKATLVIGGTTTVNADVQLPTDSSPGHVTLSSPGDITVDGLLTAIGLQSLSNVAVIGTLVRTTITAARIDIGYPRAAGGISGTLAVLDTSVDLQCDGFSLGPVQIDAVALAIKYTTDDGAALEPGGKSGTSFQLEAILADAAVLTVAYDIKTDTIASNLRMISRTTIHDMLAKVLPSVIVNVLDYLIGGFAVTNAGIGFGSDGSLKSFSASLDNDTTFASVRVTSLVVAYDCAQNQAPERLMLDGDLTIGGVGARIGIECKGTATQTTVTATLASASAGVSFSPTALLSQYNLTWSTDLTAQKAPDFFQLAVKSATLKLSGKPNWKVDSAAINVDFTLFEEQFAVEIDISSSGIKADGAHVGPIDLYFATLKPYTDIKGNVTVGPTLSVDSTQPNTLFGVKTGLSLFDIPQTVDLSFTYDPTAAQYAGEVHYSGNVLGIDNPQVTFTYDKPRGLRITSLPLIADLGTAINLAKAIADATTADGDPCGALVGLVFDKAVQTKFNLTLDMVTGAGPAKSGNLVFLAGGTYTITVAGKEITGIPLPKLPFTFAPLVTDGGPPSFTVGGLLSQLHDQLVQNPLPIARALLAQTDKCIELFAAMGVTNWAKALVIALLCRGIVTPALQAAFQQYVDNQGSDVDNQGGEVTKNTNNAMSATSLTTMSQSLEQIAVAIGVLAALVKALIDLINSVIKWLADKLGAKRDEAQSQLDDARNKQQQAIDRLQRLLNLNGAPIATFTADDTVHVDWSANLPASPGFDYEGFRSVDWRVQIATKADFSDAVSMAPTSSYALDDSDTRYRGAPRVYCRVKAVYHYTGNGGILESQASHDWAVSSVARHVVKRPMPTVVALASAGPDAWSAVVTGPAGLPCRVEIVDSAHGDALVTTVTSDIPGSGPLAVALGGGVFADAQPGAKLRVRACMAGDGVDYADSDWCLGATTLDVLPAPTQLAAEVVNGVLQISWQMVAGQSYAVDVAAAAGTTLSGALQTQMVAGGCTVSGPGLANAPALRLRVHAYSATQPGVWATLDPFQVVLLAAAPTQIRPLYRPEQQAIAVTWDAPAGPAGLGYRIRLTDVTPTPPTFTVVGSPTIDASLPMPQDATSRRFTVAVCAVFPAATPPTARGPWSVEVAIAPKAVPAAAALTARFVLPDQVAARWQAATPPAPSYEVELRRGGAVLQKATTPTQTQTFKGGGGHPLVPAGDYRVRVVTIDGASASLPAECAVELPPLVAIAQALQAADSTPAQAAQALLGLPGANAAILLAAMVAAKWTAAESQAALAPHYPQVTAAQWSTLTQDLGQPETLAPSLQAMTTTVGDALAVMQVLFAVRTSRLVVDLKAAGYPKALLPGVTPALLDAVYDQPWNLGAQLAGMPAARVPLFVLKAYPTLPFVAVACSLDGGGYGLADTGSVLRTTLSVSAAQFANVAVAIQDDGTGPRGPGRPLGLLLRGAGLDASTAARYLQVVFPTLTDAQVQAALAPPSSSS